MECKKIAESIGNNSVSDATLKTLRDRAIDELGVRISAKKLFTKLKSVFDPKQFINRQPYDKELVEKAGKWYDLLLKSADDIRALEKIEQDSAAFAFFQITLDDDDFKSLTAQDYLEKHPNGLHKQEAVKLISDSTDEEARKEEEYFRQATADNYLSMYPHGKHEEEARYYIDRRWWEYLNKYPNGRYQDDAKGVRAGIFFLGFILVVLIIVLVASATQ